MSYSLQSTILTIIIISISIAINILIIINTIIAFYSVLLLLLLLFLIFPYINDGMGSLLGIRIGDYTKLQEGHLCPLLRV